MAEHWTDIVNDNRKMKSFIEALQTHALSFDDATKTYGPPSLPSTQAIWMELADVAIPDVDPNPIIDLSGADIYLPLEDWAEDPGDFVVSASQLTVPDAGWYDIFVTAYFPANFDGVRAAWHTTTSGLSYNPVQYHPPTNMVGGLDAFSKSSEHLRAGDSISFYANQNSGVELAADITIIVIRMEALR